MQLTIRKQWMLGWGCRRDAGLSLLSLLLHLSDKNNARASSVLGQALMSSKYKSACLP